MKQITVQIDKEINIELLQEQFNNALLNNGMQWYPDEQRLVVECVDDNIDDKIVKDVIKNHQHTDKSQREIKHANRKVIIEAGKVDIKGNNPNAKDLAKYIQALEARIEFLEELLGVE